MKKMLALLLAVVMALCVVACTPTEKTEDVNAKSEGVMTYAEFDAAELNTAVVVEAYVQAHQSWWNNTITVYAVDGEGGYFFYNMACTEENAAKLVAGTKIKVTGTKTAWEGEVEVVDATFEIVEGNYVAKAVDVSALLSNPDELIKKQNQFVAVKNLEVVASGDGDAAFLYKWNGSGSQGDDLYFNVSDGTGVYTFTVESYLCGAETEVYKAVEGLKVGDKIDVEGFLYWYAGANPHITKVVVK